ncbi:hypothetical protein [Rhizomonospora bruguierae]|uniref:hypothetical protein n=1 Tax=Rhizomonospora bruguierae TaxID=1581705 RepID=UPI001BCFC2EA|nr:hypothetical protein [Micromonospora sp. NBRC 107566]
MAHYVATSRRGKVPKAASEELAPVGKALRPLPGVGDEAYLWDRNVLFRVSNLVVGIIVLPRARSTDDQVRTFAADLANRLRNG